MKKSKIKIPDGTRWKTIQIKGMYMLFIRRGDYVDLYVKVRTEVPIYE